MKFAALLIVSAVLECGRAPAQAPVNIDLTKAGSAAQWRPAHDVTAIEDTPDGIRIHISGSDPVYLRPGRRAAAGLRALDARAAEFRAGRDGAGLLLFSG